MSDYRKATEYHRKSLDIAIQIGGPEKEEAMEISVTLTSHWVTIKKAIKDHEKQLKIAIEIGDRAGEGAAYRNLSNSYQSLGDYRKVIEYQEKQLKIANEIIR